MAEEISYNEIQSFSEDWALDERNGLPYSGRSVQRFIKNNLNNKVAVQYFDPVTYVLYSFRDEESKDLWLETQDQSLVVSQTPFIFTGMVNQIKVISEMDGTNLYYTSTSDTAIIKSSFLSQQKGLTDTTWTEVFEDFYVTVAVDKGSTGNYINIVENQLVLNGRSFEVDVKKYIMNGSNRVRVTAVGATTNSTANLIYNVTLTSMYLSPSNFAWHIPFVQGSGYNVGGLSIGGSLNKNLNIHVLGENYSKLYTINLGTATYTTTPYYFKDMEFPGETGIYSLEIWLDANGLQSDHLYYDIMCVASKDNTSAQLVVMNEISDEAVNYSDNVLFYYSCYNGGTSYASPNIHIQYDGNELVSETLEDITAMSRQAYVLNMEIESEATDMLLNATMSYGNTSKTVSYPIDNSASYPATSGASFYLNASTRNNSQVNREKVVNAMNNEEYDVDWTNMAWTETSDGWIIDGNGRKCLYLPASTKANIKYKPLSTFGTGKTVELLYKVSNAADYNEPIISICDNPNSSSFRGILIKPNNLLVHSRDLNSADNIQGYSTKDEEYVHVVITIIRNYKTTYGNFCIIYVNGVKKATFTFESSDTWTTTSNIILGSESADLYLYKMRVYENGFGFQDVMNNYISCLPTSAEKIAMYNQITSIVDDSYSIDYMKVKDKYNTMVVEMLNGSDLPHYGLNKEYKAQSNLWINIFDENPEIVNQFGALSGEYLDQAISGQGTTSMNYWLWNLRWKNTPIRITAKKNYASSMQGHKMGATGAFNDLHDYVVGPNEAGTRTAVYQYPCYGFQKIKLDGVEDQYTYKFIGLYTIGPDKGDKNTFGMKNSTYKKQLAYLEGKDHPIKGVGMDYPYSEMKYVLDKEALCADRGAGEYDAAWEVATCPYDTESEIQAFLDQEFKPAYNVAYDNSTMIIGTSENIEVINANVDAWGLRTDEDGHAYQRFQFWIDGEYDLYYLSLKTGKYEKDGCNLLTQLNISESEIAGMTIKEKNELFKTKRREIFKANVGKYWHIEDTLFCYIFLVLFGATDNFKKNSYPYKFPSLASGGRWRWRQDDLDTIFDIDNQGHSTKHYAIEAHDWSDESKTAYVFKGEDSVFWRLIDECFVDELKLMGTRVLTAMYELSTSGSTTIDKMIGFIKTYFWDKAQLYFTKSAYNIDAEASYEEAYPFYKDGSYDVDVNPLEQSLGDHYEAEWNWVEKRLIYAMSKYGFGPFKEYTDTCLGRINFRTQLAQSFTLTPSMDMYPTILSGQGATSTTQNRVNAGEPVTLSGAGGTNTNVYIMAADYVRSLGDLKNLAVDASTNAAMSIAGKRLQDIKVGDENASTVTSNLQTLAVGNCPSVSIIDARNLKSLTGAVDLSGCPRLKTALFGGTDVRSIVLQNGSKISKLQLPDSVSVLSLNNLGFLEKENLEYGDLRNVEFFRIENCNQLNPFDIIKSIYNTDDNSLKDIRILGFAYDGTADDVDMLANFIKNKDKDGNSHFYNGIDAEGNPQLSALPVIEGVLNIKGSIYQDTGDLVVEAYPGLVLNVSNGYYLRFQDPEVQRIVAKNWGDGSGIKVEYLPRIDNIGNAFQENTVMTSFPEFADFTGVTNLKDYAFYKCENLKLLTLPSTINKLGKLVFYDDEKLNVNLNSSITSIGDQCFYNSGLSGSINLPNLTEIGSYGVFYNTGIKSIDNLGTIESWGDAGANTQGFAANCKSLKTVTLPETLTKINDFSFSGDVELTDINIPIATNYIGKNAFYNCSKIQLTDTEVPNLTYLGTSAFQGSGIKSINDLGSITELSKNVFQDCQELTHVALPDTLKKILAKSFYNCSSLETVEIPESITDIEDNAFYNCSSLNIDTLSLPNLNNLGQNVFNNVNIVEIADLGNITKLPTSNSSTSNYGKQSVLKSINIPMNITTIPSYSFFNYSALENVNLSEFITKIEKNAFYGCSLLALENLSLPSLSAMDEYAFANSGILSVNNLGDLNSISRYSFSNCKNLASVNLSDSIKTIGMSAFRDCSSLTNINIDNIETFDSGAFDGCTSLVFDSLSLPNMKSLGKNAFNGVKITSIEDLGSIAFFPESDTDTKKGNWGDKNTLESINIPESVTVIPNNCFNSYIKLNDVNLDHIQEIGDNAFYGCTGLSFDELVIPNLLSFGKDVFNKVSISKIMDLGKIASLPESTSSTQNYGIKTDLIYVNLPSDITEIPAYSFYYYENLETCNISNQIIKIGDSAFNTCRSLGIEDLILPNLIELGNSVFKYTKIKKVSNLGKITKLSHNDKLSDSGVFTGCSELIDVKLPETLVEIGKYTFKNCQGLTTIVLPNSVTSVKDESFAGCSNLTRVYLGSNISSIDSNAFRNDNKLNVMVCNAATPPALNSTSFNDTNPSFIVYVPDGSVELYKNASGWLTFSSRIKGLSELTDQTWF